MTPACHNRLRFAQITPDIALASELMELAK